MFCYTIIERNNRQSIPVVRSGTGGDLVQTCTNPLDSFFPFDPYLLKRYTSRINNSSLPRRKLQTKTLTVGVSAVLFLHWSLVLFMLRILIRHCQRFELKLPIEIGEFSFVFCCFKQSLKYHSVSLIHILLELWWCVIFLLGWFGFFSVLLLDWRQAYLKDLAF